MTALDKTRRPLERRSQSCEADTESDVATEGARGVPQGGDRGQETGCWSDRPGALDGTVGATLLPSTEHETLTSPGGDQVCARMRQV